MSSTIRETILESICLSLRDVTGGAPVSDPYPLAFSDVVRGPLRLTSPKRLLAGVVAMKENKSLGTSFVTCRLEVSIDFRYRSQPGEVPASFVETIIGMVQRRILSDRTLNGLAVDVDETGNVVDLDDPEDASAEGAVFFIVEYRHDLDDPRKYLGQPVPEATAT